MVWKSQAGLYYRGTYLIRSTAGKEPALKVPFPLWHNTTIERNEDRIVPLAEFEIEMLKTRENRNDQNLLDSHISEKQNSRETTAYHIWCICFPLATSHHSSLASFFSLAPTFLLSPLNQNCTRTPPVSKTCKNKSMKQMKRGDSVIQPCNSLTHF